MSIRELYVFACRLSGRKIVENTQVKDSLRPIPGAVEFYNSPAQIDGPATAGNGAPARHYRPGSRAWA